MYIRGKGYAEEKLNEYSTESNSLYFFKSKVLKKGSQVKNTNFSEPIVNSRLDRKKLGDKNKLFLRFRKENTAIISDLNDLFDRGDTMSGNGQSWFDGKNLARFNDGIR